MYRMIFEKKGNAVWISHLDLMRLFQRAFRRADLHLTHSQGYNPRPSVSIALPLSVGIESECELLDFALEGERVTEEDICNRLNAALTDGIQIKKVYSDGRKLRELVYLHSIVTLEYDNNIPEDAVALIAELFQRNELIVSKKTKSGLQDQDLIPMIRQLTVRAAGEQEVQIEVIGCCQNPTLNPMQLAAAVKLYLPEIAPDFAKCRRIRVLDGDMNEFR